MRDVEPQCIVETVDIDGDGNIDFEEFWTLLVQVKDMGLSTGDGQDGTDEEDEDIDGVADDVTLNRAEVQAVDLKRRSMAAFQRAVAVIAFEQMGTHTPFVEGTCAKNIEGCQLRESILAVLQTPPNERTEWDLQRLVLWIENFDFMLPLPSLAESDSRIELCRCMELQHINAGETVYSEGDRGTCLYIVLEGAVAQDQMNEIGRSPPNKLGERTTFGELAVMGDATERSRTGE